MLRQLSAQPRAEPEPPTDEARGEADDPGILARKGGVAEGRLGDGGGEPVRVGRVPGREPRGVGRGGGVVEREKGGFELGVNKGVSGEFV